MQKENYNEQMEKILLKIKEKESKPSLLLHSCCAPCSSSVLERLKDFFEITVYYYNPNLDGINEFSLRLKEQKRICEFFGVNCLAEDYNPQEFLSLVNGLEKEIEGGARCTKCFYLRLSKTAHKAKVECYDYFATTLTVSPLKNANLINSLGKALENKIGVNYLVSNFKKKNGYKRSIELSKEHDLYRQNYCGCIFSRIQRS